MTPTKDLEQEVHYQLYKLLAYAIQELSFYANPEEIAECLEQPQTAHILSNRAQMAVERIEKQDPHFFSGYVKYKRRKETVL
jgi:hypothetical protein